MPVYFKNLDHASGLMFSSIETPIGTVLAITDDSYLYSLVFTEVKKKEALSYFKKKPIVFGRTKITQLVEKQLKAYFKKDRLIFDVPMALVGTEFQNTVWQLLMSIPLGEVRSYKCVAQAINRPTAYRAVARANATNSLPIIIPCHRVINNDGGLGGYGGGLERKQWLLNHEKEMTKVSSTR